MKVYCVWADDGTSLFSTVELAEEHADKLKETDIYIEPIEVDEKVNWVERTYWVVAMGVQSGRPAVYERERVANPDIDEDEPMIRIRGKHLEIQYYSEEEFRDESIGIDSETAIQAASFRSADHAKKQAFELRQRILDSSSV